MAWTDPTTGGSLDWANGLVVASTDMDQIRENLLHIGGSTGLDWVDWTPTVDQGGAVAVTVNEAQYVKIRTTCIVKARLTVTGAGTSGSAIKVQGMPAAITPVASTITGTVGAGVVFDPGSILYQAAVSPPISGTTAIQFIVHGYASALGTTAFSLGSSDTIAFTAIWETS